MNLLPAHYCYTPSISDRQSLYDDVPVAASVYRNVSGTDIDRNFQSLSNIFNQTENHSTLKTSISIPQLTTADFLCFCHFIKFWRDSIPGICVSNMELIT